MSGRVGFKGPLFNAGTRKTAMRAMKVGILRSVTQFAFESVSSILAASIKNPTPVYQTLITIDGRLGDRWRVTDQGGVVYNYWLEGTGSRNFPVTGFRGYHAFQRAYEMTQNRAAGMARIEVNRTIRKLGG